jgi:Ni/Co efflux regulator RcnB
MRASKWWVTFCLAAILGFSGGPLLAQGKGHDKDKGKDKDKHEDSDDRGRYSDHDRDEIRRWCDDHRDNLPPGLAKKDRLPPGLERQLVVRGTLPPGLRRKIVVVPVELERRLPPPPPDCRHVVIGGHIVLVNQKSWLVMDVFHIEIR